MKKIRLFSPSRIAILCIVLLSIMVPSQAQTFIGTAGDGLWSNTNNWLDGVKPDGMFSEATISADVIIDEDISIGTLTNAGNYSLTILSGKTLIVNVAIYWDGNDFILEDNAELVYREPIHVLLKKKINAYHADNHIWNLIASPVSEDIQPSTENGFLTEPETGYALYSFNENAAIWTNYKESPFAIEHGKGYLYANALDTTLLFEGTTVGYSAETTLPYHEENGALAGCNFIGNPLPCYAFLNRSYYVLSEESNSLIAVANSATKSIAPCTGILVDSNGPEDNKVNFSYMPFFQYLGSQGYIEITAAKSNAPTLVLDQALLSFNPEDDLAKYALFENSPKVYFTKDGKDLAILSIDSVDVQPLKFKAFENGTYTLHFELKQLSPIYLHLIDNITGANIDLLTTPNYTFNATTTDYASRFKLIFDPHYGVGEDGPSADSEAFAYYANGEIVINDVEACHGASLQIIDMTGRVIMKRDAINRVSTSDWAKGIYVLRLTTPHGVRTQKMVIE